MQNNHEALRLLRPLLVRAAEKVFTDHHNARTAKPKELKSQLNHLIAVCNEATCHEEIALYLRYQAAREGRHIEPSLVEAMISATEEVFSRQAYALADSMKVASWRLYAVYLARAYTYTAKASQQSTNNVPRPPNPQPQRRR